MDIATFNTLKTGDLVQRQTTGGVLVVTRENRGITPGANQVTAQVLGADGNGHGRGYTIDAVTCGRYDRA